MIWQYFMKENFVKFKISTVSAFWRFGKMETVDYRGTTKKVILQNVLYLMSWKTFVKEFFCKIENKHSFDI